MISTLRKTERSYWGHEGVLAVSASVPSGCQIIVSAVSLEILKQHLLNDV